MSHNFTIKDGAIFVADVHFNPNRKEFLEFLAKIQNGTLQVSQLFLMGDIFDFLASEIEYFKSQNSELIKLIDDLSKSMELFYFEGNHDYNLSKLFPNIKVFKREVQPVVFSWNEKKVALAHGDIFTPLGYNIYTAIIRNHPLLVFLNSIDIDNWLTKKIDFWLRKKNLTHTFKDFDLFATRRIEKYASMNVDIIIEGHFHQGCEYRAKEEGKRYINISSFGVDRGYLYLLQNSFTKRYFS